MCHYYLQGSNPLSSWSSDPANPVVRGGQLFSKICAGTGKHCTGTKLGLGLGGLRGKLLTE
jgi:hypothetical protein